MIDRALGVALGDVATLVALAFAETDSDQELCPAPHEIDLQWDQGRPLGMHLTGKLHDLTFVGQQLSDSNRVVLAMGSSRGVLRDVYPVERQGGRLVFSPHPTFGKADLRISN